MRIIGPVEQGGPLMLPICRNGMQGQPPVRAKADFAHELRVRCHLGDVTREECDRQLAALGVAADPVAEEAARICAVTRQQRQAGTFQSMPESEYWRRAAAGKAGR
jgi:hypothetical protein